MFAKTTAAVLIGVDPREVAVEARVFGQRDAFSLVGLPDAAVREARQRVSSAMAQTGYAPTKSVTVNLGPADLPKTGSGFDLPIALAVLAAAKQIPHRATRVVAMGELALDGRVRESRGGLAAALVARSAGVPCLLPPEAAIQASWVTGADVRAVTSLADAVAVASGDVTSRQPSPVDEVTLHLPDLADVRGQALGRRALEIAAAGGHHLIFTGPPGCGKTMLAQRLPSILPELTTAQSLDVACVWAAASRWRVPGSPPPFRAPHHSASIAAILGGGSGIPVPGEISLAHHGVLFLDELGEYPPHLLDSLRQPMEQGCITIARKGASVTYPSAFQVVAATNPCPCGYLDDSVKQCICARVGDSQVSPPAVGTARGSVRSADHPRSSRSTRRADR